jgi:hypothetical protein
MNNKTLNVLTDTHIAIARELLNKIENEKDDIKITYGELSKRLGGYPHHRHLDKYLGCLSSLCRANDLPLISTIVVNGQTNIAGDGYFSEFFGHLMTKQQKEKQYEKCLDMVKRCKDWDKLKYILNSNNILYEKKLKC